jgi:hypothetical protein
MAAHDIRPGRAPRGVACAGHVFAAHVRADPGLVWTALTDPGRTAVYLYGLAAHSTWVPGDPIEFRLGDRAAAIGQVMHACRQERLSYVLQAGRFALARRSPRNLAISVLRLAGRRIAAALRYRLCRSS